MSKLILFGERSLRRALSEYLAHYHAERNHLMLVRVLADFSRPIGAPQQNSERDHGGRERDHDPEKEHRH